MLQCISGLLLIMDWSRWAGFDLERLRLAGQTVEMIIGTAEKSLLALSLLSQYLPQDDPQRYYIP